MSPAQKVLPIEKVHSMEKVQLTDDTQLTEPYLNKKVLHKKKVHSMEKVQLLTVDVFQFLLWKCVRINVKVLQISKKLVFANSFYGNFGSF